jgi:iron complex outermembrane receptor protein
LRLLALAACAALLLPAAFAASPAGTEHFQIPAGEAETALGQFARQAGVELVFGVEKVGGVTTRGIEGDYTPLAALRRMLAGTPLVVVQDTATGALAVNRKSLWTFLKGPEPLAPPPVPLPHDRAAPAGPPAAPEVVKLPQFTVSSAAADRYRLSDTDSATRIRGQLANTPLSIAVISSDVLQDLGANSMYDATRYFSGVSNGRGSGDGGILDRQDFRGFESFSRTVDGLSTILIPSNNGFQANLDPQFIERIEVVKGPDSILAPTGSPGGSINVITKSPQAAPASDLTIQAGNENADKATLDSTGPLPLFGDPNWSYRVIADYQDGATYVPGSIRTWDLSAQLRYRLSDVSEVTVKYFGQQWELTGAIADPNDNGSYVTAPSSVRGATLADTPPPGSGFAYDGWNGDTTWSSRYDRVNLVTAEFVQAFSDRINMRLAGAVLSDNFDQNAGYLSAAVPQESWDPVTGQETAIGNNFNPASAAEIANHVKILNRDEQLQNDFAGNFDLGGISLQPVAGWTYQQGGNPTARDWTAPLPNSDLLSPLPYSPPRPGAAAYAPASATRSHAWQSQAYALVNAGFYDDRIFLVGGASSFWARSTSANLLAGHPTVLDGNHGTYLGGVLVKPVKSLSVYYTLSSNAAITVGANQAPVWQTGRQNEFGLKAEFLEQRLSFTAARFSIGESNLSSPNPLYNTDPANNASVLLTDETNHGYELELTGGLTKNLSVIASLTEMKLRDSYGRRQRNVPDETAALLLEYRWPEGLLKNLSVFAGAVHSGDSAGETVTGFTPLGVPEQPGFYVAGWTVYNAGAGYRWGRYRFNLNVDNVLNSKFLWQPTGRNSVSPYPGTAVRLTTMVHF